MAYGIVHHFPGGTKEQYEASLAVVHPSRDRLPPGQIYHAAGPSTGGWTIVAIHDSKASWERFRDGTLMPKKVANKNPAAVAKPIASAAMVTGSNMANIAQITSSNARSRPKYSARGRKAGRMPLDWNAPRSLPSEPSPWNW